MKTVEENHIKTNSLRTTVSVLGVTEEDILQKCVRRIGRSFVLSARKLITQIKTVSLERKVKQSF